MELTPVYNPNGTISIMETVKKPSVALRLMYEGIKKQSKRKTFVVDMGTYGEVNSRNSRNICYGCAATCTIQQLAGKNLTTKNITFTEDRAYALNFDINELELFERCIDGVRKGRVSLLFYFFGENEITKYNGAFFLNYAEDFDEQKDIILNMIKQLEKDGY